MSTSKEAFNLAVITLRDRIYNRTLRAAETTTSVWAETRTDMLAVAASVDADSLADAIKRAVNAARKQLSDALPHLSGTEINKLSPMLYARRVAGAVNRDGLTTEEAAALLPMETESAGEYLKRISPDGGARKPGGATKAGEPEAAKPEAKEVSPLQEAADAADSGAIPFQKEFATIAAKAAADGHGLAFWQAAVSFARDYAKARTVATAPAAKAAPKRKPAAVSA